MPTASFVRPAVSSPLFFLQHIDDNGSPWIDRRTGWVPPGASSALSCDVAAAFGTGCVFFLGTESWDPAGFASALAAYLAASPAQFLWIANPNAALAPANVPFSVALQTPLLGSAGVSADATLQIGDLIVTLAGPAPGSGGTPPPATVASCSVARSGWSFGPLPGGSQGITFGAGGGDETSLSELFVDFGDVGIPAGRLWFQLAPPGWLLGGWIGTRFFTPAATSGVARFHFPVFPGNLAAVTPMAGAPAFGQWPAWTFAIDPNAPFDATRSNVDLGGGATPPLSLPTEYVSTAGHRVWLTPQPGARLVFVADPSPSVPGTVHLAPSGAFTLAVDGPAGAGDHALLCGVSGLEFIRARVDGHCAVDFVPGCAAAANALTSGSPASGNLLDGWLDLGSAFPDATTSWLYVRGSDVSYFAQPDGAPIYASQPGAPFLSLLELPSARLWPVPGGDLQQAFPMVAFAGVTTTLRTPTLADFESLERLAISPTRRSTLLALDPPPTTPDPSPPNGPSALIAAAPGAAAAAPAPPPEPPLPPAKSQGTTPQGLLVETSSPSAPVWDRLHLAHDATGRTLSLRNVGGNLKAALQTNQQFIVGHDPAVFADALKDAHVIGASGWTFDLDPDRWSEHGTVVLFKFFKNKSVSELVADTSLWTQPDTFCQDPSGTQADLQAWMADVFKRAAADSDRDFQFLANNVLGPPSDPSSARQWQGVLVVNCPVPLTGLPPALMGLGAGISPSLFYAHHMGLDLTPVTRRGSGVLQPGPTSLFGVIHYQAGPNSGASAGAYSFKVNDLDVLIESSEVKNFASTVSLGLGNLFDYPVVPGTPPGPLRLQGYYQVQNGTPSYAFVGSAPLALTLAASGGTPVVTDLTLTKARFSTLHPPGATPDDPVASRFDFDGVLQLATAEGADLFSYTSLPFMQLGLEMSFLPSAPLDSLAFTPDFGRLVLDCNSAKARPASLVAKLPLRLRAFASGTGAPPQTFEVDLPSPASESFAGVSGAWRGLVFDFDFGALGALSGGHVLTASLTVGWTAGGAVPAGATPAWPVSAWLRLPFTGGTHDELALEDVLKLGLKSAQLTATATGADVAWTLLLKQIGLKVLGLTLPTGAAIDLELAGPPSGAGRELAWYAGWNESDT